MKYAHVLTIMILTLLSCGLLQGAGSSGPAEAQDSSGFQQQALEAQKEAIDALAKQKGAQGVTGEHVDALNEASKALSAAIDKEVNSNMSNFVAKAPTFLTPGAEPTGSSMLIIPSIQVTPEYLEQMNEDMQVMSQIINDTVHQEQKSQSKSWFYNNIIGGWFDNNSNISGLCIQGYGIIFTQTADYPLIPSETIAENTTGEDGADQVWQNAKKKLQGQDTAELSDKKDAPKYDADKVEKLKTNCIAILKHAANIRNLKSDELIVVVIRHISIKEDISYSVVLPRAGNKTGLTVETTASSQKQAVLPSSCLILRAQKKDIDTFAQNKIDSDAFKTKVQMISY